jgi:TfoX/Sxy family transcriptional regulator of competence genes
MTTKLALVDKVLDEMLPLEVAAKSMFGEYGLYHRGKNFALICDDTLFIKVTEPGLRLAGRVATAPPYPGAKPAFKISSAKRRERDWLIPLIEATCHALPKPKPKPKPIPKPKSR